MGGFVFKEHRICWLRTPDLYLSDFESFLIIVFT